MSIDVTLNQAQREAVEHPAGPLLGKCVVV
jgi:hypothetical protein